MVLGVLTKNNMKKYQVIYADPPWDTGYLKGGKTPGSIGGGSSPGFPSMTDNQIIGLPVKDITSNDAVLFLWALDGKIPLVLKIMKSWGFTYKGVGFVWSKCAKNDKMLPRATLSIYTRRSCEFCFLGVKGRTSKLIKSHKVRQLITVPPPRRRHGQKPDEVRQAIVELLGDVSRIELFARDKSLGWDVWGNEVKSDINL